MKSLFESLEASGIHSIVLYGVNPLSEIAFISVQETGIEIAGVVDDEHMGEMFMQMKVLVADRLRWINYDRLLITELKNAEKMQEKLMELEVPAWKIVSLDRTVFPYLN